MNLPADATVIELGAGCALPSLALAGTGRRVIATDASPSVLSNIEHNAAENQVELEVVRYDWGDTLPASLEQALEASAPVHIIGSDLCYAGPGPQAALSAALKDNLTRHSPEITLAIMHRPHHADAFPEFQGKLHECGLEACEFKPKNDLGQSLWCQLTAGGKRSWPEMALFYWTVVRPTRFYRILKERS
eukprot:TRINITY_DN62440_c0_g1_i1.p1 TRINITY_DN62440_c0_g1~~TRINITY_DN62440_c0_g1_i1.p1  ORF type:complete len:190 (-),score=36.53 TRINITY_DN62440_c0_g1_i1:143-712(-)